MRYTIIEGYDQFCLHQQKIVKLFADVFERPYPLELWDHFYKHIPVGDVVGICGWDDEQLVAFDALLPQEIVYPADASSLISYGLSASTMIMPGFRFGGRTFCEMQDNKIQVARSREYKFILAFPNQTSYMPFVHLSDYILIDEARLCQGDISADGYLSYLQNETKKAFFSKRMWNWRMERCPYLMNSGYVLKNYQGKTQILDLFAVEEFKEISGVFPCWKSSGMLEQFLAVNDYVVRMCYYPIDNGFDTQSIKRSVMLSDVF